MELRDTTKGMESSDYKVRFAAEYWQTKIRYEKLKAFNTRIEAARIRYEKLKAFNTRIEAALRAECAGDVETKVEMPKHDCPANLLRDQQSAMGEYLHILEVRAVIEGIDLSEPYWMRENTQGEPCKKSCVDSRGGERFTSGR